MTTLERLSGMSLWEKILLLIRVYQRKYFLNYYNKINLLILEFQYRIICIKSREQEIRDEERNYHRLSFEIDSPSKPKQITKTDFEVLNLQPTYKFVGKMTPFHPADTIYSYKRTLDTAYTIDYSDSFPRVVYEPSINTEPTGKLRKNIHEI